MSISIYISYKTARVVGLTPSLKSQGRGLKEIPANQLYAMFRVEVQFCGLKV